MDYTYRAADPSAGMTLAEMRRMLTELPPGVPEDSIVHCTARHLDLGPAGPPVWTLTIRPAGQTIGTDMLNAIQRATERLR